MTKLVKLDVSYNRMMRLFDEQTQMKISNEYIGWPKLRIANLSNNYFRQIPLIICNSPNVIVLIINNNKINKIR